MMGDDKDKENDVEPITDADLGDVVGGRRSTPTTVTGKFSGNDTIVGVASEDELIARAPGKTGNNFNIGMPPYVKKR